MTEIKYKTKYVKIDLLKVHPKNPRLIKDDEYKKLCESIKTDSAFFEARPILYNKENIIFAGNQRWRAAKEIGLKEVPAIRMDIPEKQQEKIMIKDNRQSGFWDMDILANQFELDDLLDWGFDKLDLGMVDGIDFPTLKDGDKEPFQQMTFTLADQQATIIQNALADMKKSETYKYAETLGNENSNGNALYLIVSEWAEQKKY